MTHETQVSEKAQHKLVAFSNAAQSCGDWRYGDDEDYEEVYARWEAERDEVFAYICSLEADALPPVAVYFEAEKSEAFFTLAQAGEAALTLDYPGKPIPAPSTEEVSR
jgi:hypothetical protein